ncbi:MAG: hypothetical protein ACO1SX_28025, partial [Actinomycetota bacterium]
MAAGPAAAQKAPEMGYVYPPGGRAGSTVDVRLCGYDWTPDMQFFTLTPGVKLEITGPPGPILVPPPPYWFGAKAYLTALPLPREVPARLTLPANLPPGPIRWQAANANGGTATGVFLVSAPSEGTEVLENPRRRAPQPLPSLPAVVNGRLEKIEEVDRYRFTAARPGPVTVELTARGLGAAFNGMVEVRDSSGRMVADAADTTANDLTVTFNASAGTEYTLSLHDVDFRGDRSYVYRLNVRPGPRVLAALPAAGTRGETRSVEFLLDTGAKALERVKREVRFPSEPETSAFTYNLQSEGGASTPCTLRVTDVAETVTTSGAASAPLVAPGAVTGILDDGRPEMRYQVRGKAGEIWKIAAEARALGSTLDVALRVLTPDGKEAAKSDDLPGTTDAGLEYTVPAEGEYTLAVADLSGKHAAGPGLYRLSVERSAPDFRLEAPQQLSLPLGGSADLSVKVIRQGGFKAPITLTFSGLPEGVSAPAAFEVPAGAAEAKIPLRCAADVAVTAAVGTVTGSAMVDGKAVVRSVLAPAAGNLAALSPEEIRIPEILFSVTMKPVCKVEPVDKDGGRRIHRGATYPAPVIITRMEGFQGEVGLQMAARQSYTCMGITGPDIVVPAGVTRTTYPCFMPEWLETSRTSRMITIAVAKVADPKGNVRHLVSLMDGRITMAMEGALLKITHAPEERTIQAGASFKVPVKIARSPDLPLPVKITLALPEELQGMVKAEPLLLEPGRSEGEITVTTTGDPSLLGDQSITFRATAMLPGDLAVVSETQVPIL